MGLRHRAVAEALKDEKLAATLPEVFAEQVRAMPETSMGANRIRVRLRDGSEFPDVYVAWGDEIVRVGTSSEIPFNVEDIAHVEHQP